MRQSTVSRSLIALEKRLNVALFVRSTLGTTPAADAV
ncbi:helix-turn-helix domain-containing protein [Acetobacter syzygii]